MSRRPLMRIPFTSALPPAKIVPADANNLPRAIAVLTDFLTSQITLSTGSRLPKTVLLTGAGLSVPSGLSDYRGTKGTYKLNPAHRPIYFSEFIGSHESRKRYWARSFLGWPAVARSRPNAAHHAIAALGGLIPSPTSPPSSSASSSSWSGGSQQTEEAAATTAPISSVITQNVDSFHHQAHPDLPTVEIHGALRQLICVGCRQPYPRPDFQRTLADLNPAWAELLQRAIDGQTPMRSASASGSKREERDELQEEGNPVERAGFGIKTNPDGDVDLPDAPYTTFRYPACPRCLADPQSHLHPVSPASDGHPRSPQSTARPASETAIETTVDRDGAWTSGPGILKPGVIMFGESVETTVRTAALQAIAAADRMLVVGSSLATMSALSLVRAARAAGKPVGVVNLGGVRDETELFSSSSASSSPGPAADGEIANGRWQQKQQQGVRLEVEAEKVLPGVVEEIKRRNAMR